MSSNGYKRPARQLKERGLRFMAAVRGIPAHHVTKAMTALTPGVNWMYCSKRHIAENLDDSIYPACARVDIERLARMARARANHEHHWEKA